MAFPQALPQGVVAADQDLFRLLLNCLGLEVVLVVGQCLQREETSDTAGLSSTTVHSGGRPVTALGPWNTETPWKLSENIPQCGPKKKGL